MHNPSISPAQIPPVIALDPQCAWCWPIIHPGLPYPESWSSTCCDAHAAWILVQHTQIKAQRLARKEAQAW